MAEKEAPDSVRGTSHSEEYSLPQELGEWGDCHCQQGAPPRVQAGAEAVLSLEPLSLARLGHEGSHGGHRSSVDLTSVVEELWYGAPGARLHRLLNNQLPKGKRGIKLLCFCPLLSCL